MGGRHHANLRSLIVAALAAWIATVPLTAQQTNQPVVDLRQSISTAVDAAAHMTFEPFAFGPTRIDVDRPRLRAQDASTAAAARRPKWEVELFGGGMLASHPTGGTAALPGPGAAFTTANSRPSRRESSWYFGDGTVLLNQVNTGFNVSQRITPLDTMLNTSVAQRESAGAFGVRISRIINPRFTVEVTVEDALGRLGLTSASLAAIEASRASFISAFNGLFATGPFNNSSVTSTARTTHPGRQLFTTGAVNIALKQSGKTLSYVTVGAGIVSSLGDAPSTSLVGDYQFLFAGTVPIHETDSVTLRYTTGHVFVSVFGGGLKYYLSPRWGVRLDARVYLSPNTIDTLVDASPRVFTLTPSGFVASATTPSVQFSNTPASGNTSSLSATTSGFRTFAGDGIQRQVSVTAGVFRRF